MIMNHSSQSTPSAPHRGYAAFALCVLLLIALAVAASAESGGTSPELTATYGSYVAPTPTPWEPEPTPDFSAVDFPDVDYLAYCDEAGAALAEEENLGEENVEEENEEENQEQENTEEDPDIEDPDVEDPDASDDEEIAEAPAADTDETEQDGVSQNPAAEGSENAAVADAASAVETASVSSEQTTTDSLINILILGTDEEIEGTKDTGRSDCIMVASVNLTQNCVKLISFERAIIVPIPAGMAADGSTSDLLTYAYRWGGAPLVQQIIEEQFNLKIDGYIRANFYTFETLIDLLGGFDVELTEREAWGLNCGYVLGTGSGVSHYVEAGANHFDGADTLAYCRLRSIDDDWARQQRQRNVMVWAVQQLRECSLTDLNRLANQVLYYADCTLSPVEIARLLVHAEKIANNDVEQLQVPYNPPYPSKITCDFASETVRIRNFLSGEAE